MSPRFSQLDGMRLGVWGAGREIRSLAQQLSARLPGARIAVAAFDGAPPPRVREELLSPELTVVRGEQAPDALGGCDLVVRSPGVSIHRAELRALRDAGVTVTTATALWLADREGRGVIGVTGTKGKSTTAALIAHLARAAGREAHLAGNIGVPALDLLDLPPSELVVLELSSYQIADLDCGPEIALVTNLFREHTDWHGSEDAYRQEKLRLLALPGVRRAVLNGRDERLGAAAPESLDTVLYGLPSGWDATAAGIEIGGELALELSKLPLAGAHNALNLCGALAALEACGIEFAGGALAGALAGFSPLPHRLEPISDAGGAVWVDDSISTTPESTLAALAAFPDREIVLIAGGQDRGQDHSELARAIASRGASVVAIPSTGPRLLAELRAAGVGPERAVAAADLAAAVAMARSLARPGSAVLLSPAAPSYDSFRDFEERGERFRALVGS